ncbi:MAG: CDP-glycerol glycerophosphotransferase family protein [Promethearchaeota archaeon]
MSLKRNISENILSKIKIKRFAKILRIKPQFFFDLVIHHLSRLFPSKIDKDLIVFGSSNGKAFVGNTKYLYNFLRNHSRYKLKVFVGSKSLQTSLKRDNIDAVYKFSIESINILRKAHFIFTTHGITDILPIRFSPQTIFVETWHGVQNKKNRTEGEMYYSPKLSKLLGLKTRNKDVIDYFITPSGTKADINIITHHFEIPKERILATGFPRNDIFFIDDVNYLKSIRKKYLINEDYEKVLIYAPTFRDNTLIGKFPLNTKELEQLNDVLEKRNSILILKGHIAEKQITFQNLSNISTIEQEADIQELLVISDVLITDYSSVYCDYLLLNRPILFFTYDYDEFMSKGRGFYYDFKEIAPGPMVSTGSDLIKEIEQVLEGNDKYEQKRIETRKIYHKHIDGKSSERLLRFLKIL